MDDDKAWSVSMEGLALQTPDRPDELPLRSTLQFTFKPAHAMATLFRALAAHTKAYSVRLPEADYTLAVKVRTRCRPCKQRCALGPTLFATEAVPTKSRRRKPILRARQFGGVLRLSRACSCDPVGGDPCVMGRGVVSARALLCP